jgi:hypothetical protein
MWSEEQNRAKIGLLFCSSKFPEKKNDLEVINPQ